MAGYIPWYGKKRRRLGTCEREFCALLQSQTDRSKLADAADEVRAAHVRVLKSRRAELAPSETNTIAVENLDREIALWLELSAEQIIERYRSGALRHRASRAIRPKRNKLF